MFKAATANTTSAKSSNSSLFQKEKGEGAFIQPKLTIGKPGDKYEVEADKVADKVVAKGNDQSNSFFSPAPLVQKQSEEEVQKQEIAEKEVQQKPLVEHISPLVRRQPEEEPIQQKEEQEEIQQKPEEEIQKQEVAEDKIQQKTENSVVVPEIQKQEEEVQEKEEEEEELQAVQAKINTAVSSNGVENSSIESRLNSSKGGGSPLPKDTKSQMESGFGTDFSNVRVHTDSNAKQMSQDMGAQAFTHGNDIYFNEGKFDTSSNSGKHLLAHELTHTVQQGGGIKRKVENVTSAPKMIQGSFLDWIPDWILNNARNIPGYLLFTVIIQYDPLLGQRVELTPINLLRGLIGLVPFGVAIFDKLQEYNIIQQVFDWVSGRLGELNLTTQGLLNLVEETWENNSVTSFVGALREEFNGLVIRITTFANSLIDQVITWIKEALIDVAEPLLEENRAWSLIKKIIHYDPLRDEEVTATTVEILEDFLMLIGKETELEQMRERGTLQETADWLDTQVGTFMSLLGELRGLINAAWEAIRPANLTEITANLTALSGRVTGFLERVWAFAQTVAIEVLKLIKKALLSWLSSVANETRGFSLIKVIIGKDPFTDEHVPRTVPNLIRGFMSLMDGGEAQYAQMVETGAIARIVGEIDAAVETLNMTPQSIVQLFVDLWNSFSIDDLLNPIDAFVRIIDQFGEPISRLIAFVAEIVRIVIVAILEIMNFPFELIGNIITRSLQAMEDIKRDPIGFLKNILRAIKEGFVKFFDNIVTHLINGVMGWLMRELRDAGIPELTDFSLQGVISWVLEVLGLSMERIWEKLAEHPRIGPERVARIRGAINTLEGIWTFIKDVQERGIAAIWDKIQEQLSNLWNVVIDAVKNFVMTRIITQITARLLSMLDPTGIMAVVNGAMAFFSAVQSFIQYLREMLEVINSFVNGVADIAQGNVATAADYLERTMGQSMPVVIGFLANQVGLGGIGARIAEIIGSVRVLIDEALTWLVNKAVDTGMALLDRVMGRSGSEEASENNEEGNGDGEIGKEVTFNDGEEGHRLWVDSSGTPELMVASANPMAVSNKLTIWSGEIDNQDWSEEKKTEVRGLIATATTLSNATDQEINNYTNNESTESPESEASVQRSDDQIESNEDRLKEILRQLFSAFNETSTLTVEVAQNDKIKAKYKNGMYRAVVNNVDDSNENPEQNKVAHQFNWERLQERNQENAFSSFNEKWGSDIVADSGTASEHNEYKPQNVVPSVEGDSFVLNYDYGPEGLGRDELERVEVRMRIDDVSERKVNHSVTGRNMGIKASGSRGRTDSAGRLIREGVDTTNLPQLNSAHLMADWFQGSGYRQGLNLILTSDTYNQTTMAGAEGKLVGKIRKLQSQNEPLLVTFDLQVTAIYEVTKDDKVVEVLRGLKANMTAEALAKMHRDLAGDQDPRRCEKVTYDVLAVKAGGVGIPHSIRQIEIGPDVNL